MALAAAQTGMNLEGKGLHPFFSKIPNDQHPDQNQHADPDPIFELRDVFIEEHADGGPQLGKGPKKRARKSQSMTEEKIIGFTTKNQLSLEHFTRPSKAHDTIQTEGNDGNLVHTTDADQDRRKRRKTVSPAPSIDLPATTQLPSTQIYSHHQLQAEAGQLPPTDQSAMLTGSTPVEPTAAGGQEHEHVQEAALQAAPAVVVNVIQPDTAVTPPAQGAEEPKKIAPVKQIKVTKNGKLLSSPPKPVAEPTVTPKKRRSRKSTKAVVYHPVTVIKYGSDITSRIAIGQQIERILNGDKVVVPAQNTKQKPVKPVQPPKATHPFFTGKSSHKKEPSVPEVAPSHKPTTPRKSAVTPGKLRSEAGRERSPGPVAAFGMGHNTTRVNKQSELNEAPWPTRETVHVRCLNQVDLIKHFTEQNSQAPRLKRRKQKNNVISLSDREDIISRLARDLKQDLGFEKHTFGLDFEPPKDVRLPTRLLTTGDEIQQRVHDRLQAASQPHQSTHPAITTIFNDIKHTLTPFDEGKCESQDWTHKYAPQYASHVLQNGPEATVLKDWLQSLTVMAVGGALKSSSVTDIKNPPKKKRKKAVDAFIISDDDFDEDEDMLELAAVEGMLGHRSLSVRRPRWTRNNNVILISGPHGCGKSATVYAVAKELGFEVFEINSGVRRSGKDIQDKVGDMTANHLVNHKRVAETSKGDNAANSDTETERLDTALRKDLDSGRQGTMTSFFKMQGTAKPKAVTSIAKEPRKTSHPVAQTKPPQATLASIQAARKSQKQSLILFEEADILFEEDQQFWAQVMKLASQSKRPIIITCNDEQQVPTQALPLAAILRLQPPPVDLAADYLLVLAGKEGHILDREAAGDLYRSNKNDLRASITELNFWCQMSVGDRKGGLEWMYQRWPPGKDVDESGRLLRVASEGTYHSGMGWLSHNIFQTKENAVLDKEEELLKQVWTDWNINPTAWEKPVMSANEPLTAGDSRLKRLKALERLDAYSESHSAADVYSRVGLPSYDTIYHEPTDPTQPLLTEKARSNYTLAARVLQVDHHCDFLNLGGSIVTQTELLIQRAYPDVSHASSARPSDQSERAYAKAILTHNDHKHKTATLDRYDFAEAFDILATPPDCMLFDRTSYNLMPSSFDRTFRIVTLDLAPYVRSMVAHEQILETQRIRLSNLLSAGGTGKRFRNTRASRTALEGGMRETKRRERWFDKDLDFDLVMQTAGKEWAGLGWKGKEGEGEIGQGTVTPSVAGTMDSGGEGESVGTMDEQREMSIIFDERMYGM